MQSNINPAGSGNGAKRKANREVARLLFFWDYDTQWGADRSRSVGGPKKWGHLEFENTERLLELHAQYNVPACFAVVGAAALPGEQPYHDPAQIRRIHEHGHEIASHAFRHEWLPGLDRKKLLETLRLSKDALEQCTGKEVISFVPPFNQPFDYPARWAISVSERREAGAERTDMKRLCEALQGSGYRFCRIVYSPLPIQIVERLSGRRFRGGGVETISGVTCARLNSPGGFDGPVIKLLRRNVKSGSLLVVYGHPHSLHAGNAQDESWLTPFLAEVQSLQRQGLLKVCLPNQLLEMN